MKIDEIKFWHIYSNKRGHYRQVLSIGYNQTNERFVLVIDGCDGDHGSIYWSKREPKWMLLKQFAHWAKLDISI